MNKILVFLALFNCYPKTIITPSNETFFLGGVVYMRPDMLRPEVIVHELVHACDYQNHGPAKTHREWLMRERRAMTIERAYIENNDKTPRGIPEMPISVPEALR